MKTEICKNSWKFQGLKPLYLKILNNRDKNIETFYKPPMLENQGLQKFLKNSGPTKIFTKSNPMKILNNLGRSMVKNIEAYGLGVRKF